MRLPRLPFTGARSAQAQVASCEQVRALLPLVAMDCAEPSERLEAQAHLATCNQCALELAEQQALAALLARGVPLAEPPPDLRGRVMAAALAERSPGAPAGRGKLAAPVFRAVSPAWMVAVVALVVSAATFAWAATLQGRLQDATAASQVATAKANQYDRLVSVLTSEQLAVRPASLPWSATDGTPMGRVYLDPVTRRGMVLVHEMPPLPRGRTWQLWFTRGDLCTPAGMLRTDSRGTGYSIIEVPQDYSFYQALSASDEPDAGSRYPTTPRIVVSWL